MTVRRKILIPMIALIVASTTAILLVSVWLFNRGLDDAARDRVDIAAMSAAHELETFMSSSHMAASIIAENHDMIEAVKRRSHDGILIAASRLPAVSQVDFCTILDEQGIVLARIHEPDNYGDSLFYQHNISSALNGVPTGVIERGTAVRLSVRTGVPIIDEEGNIIGVVSSGFRFDTQGFAKMLGEITGCEVTLFLDNERISTTLTDSNGRYIVGTQADSEVAATLERVRRGTTVIGHVEINDKRMISSYSPIYGNNNEIVGVLAIGSIAEDDTGRIRAFVAGVLLFFSLILLFTIIIAVISSNSINRRINSMMDRIRESEKLEMALKNAEDANKAKSAFLANVSHEIRTPMNVILGLTEIQLRDKSISNIERDRLERIYDSGKLLLSIVNDILDHSKIEAHKMEIIPTEYNVPALIGGAVQLNRLRYENKPIEFILDVDPDTPLTLIGDELRIKQILGNLLSNAYKYTEKGEIRFTTRYDKVEGTLVFVVSDTGQGMTQEQVNNLFSEFQRYNIEANRSIGGSGLGLSITKNLVELMHGEIKAESKIDEGSVFTVWLPQEQVGKEVCGQEVVTQLREFHYQNPSSVRIDHTLFEPMPYGRVLVVDDVKSNIYVAIHMLMPYGLQVEAVNSGFEAIERVKEGNTYDIIFMDQMMPKMNGIETTKKLREMGYINCIIALTANALVGQAEVFMENGFDGYISKPIDPHEINHALEKFVRRKDMDEEQICEE